KYLLGANSLTLYNCNSGNETNMWQEWWMKDDVFQEGIHYVLAHNVDELKYKLHNYINNDIYAQKIAENGYNFFKNTLSPENIEKFWSALLHEYKIKCDFEITHPLGNLFEEKSYGD
ncbi:MAG: glycosyl transferase family 90, partial [bacterium]